MQNHVNLVYREEEREMIPQCIDQGVAVLPWSPLARGLLDGQPHPRRRAPHDPRRERPVRRLALPPGGRLRHRRPRRTRSPRRAACRARRSRSPGSSAGPGITAPIVGATKVAHVEDALAAEQLELTADEVDAARRAVRAARGLRARVAPSCAGQRATPPAKAVLQPTHGRRRYDSTSRLVAGGPDTDCVLHSTYEQA